MHESSNMQRHAAAQIRRVSSLAESGTLFFSKIVCSIICLKVLQPLLTLFNTADIEK